MPERIQLRRTKGWRKPAGTVVVSRPSVLGNPFTIGAVVSIETCGYIANITLTAENCVEAYRDLMEVRLTVIDGEPGEVQFVQTWRARLHKLAGHDLACWCPLDQPCHADVLLELANRDTP